MNKTLGAMLLLAVATPAFAQDAEGDSKKGARDFSGEVVREVVKGYYVKSNIGSTIYVLSHSGFMSGVMTVQLGVGSEFLDKEHSSIAWEVDFNQSLQNMVPFDQQAANVPTNAYLQGDVHMFSGLAMIEASTYPTKRFGLGVRAGGGIMFIPVLIFPDEWVGTVVPALGGVVPAAQAGPLPQFGGGPTIEYYTKLSHFSVGLDVDVMYVIGLNDLGISPTGYMKYTF